MSDPMHLVEDTRENFPNGRFKVVSNEDQGRCATFELLDEDHTLGNALRHMILKNPEVKFCGYALPHPNERKINLQIQVYAGEALDALEKGLRDLNEINKIIREKIEQASANYGQVPFEDSEDEDDERIQKLISARSSSRS